MIHLVTGGSGFLGSLIARRLQAEGEEVRILDLWEDKDRTRGIRFFPGDIRDAGAVAQAMRGVGVVHHTAALVPLTKAGRRFWDVNVTGSRLVAEAAVKAGVQTFVHLSSSAVFGVPPACPVTAQSPLRPVEVYGRSKLAAEEAVQAVCAAKEISLVVVRPRTIIGKGRMGIFQILFDWIREHRDVYVIGSGRELLQFVHADDLISACLLAARSGGPGIYHVGARHFGSLREGLEGVIRHAGTGSRVRSLPSLPAVVGLGILDKFGLSPLAPWHYRTLDKSFYFDISPLQRLGWNPRYSNDEMLRESYDWFLENCHDLRDRESPHRRPVRERLLGVLKRFS